ncbi:MULTISPECIES: CdaR family transcriptional regulator [Oceanotoga]|jgi:carbohydrate diacid regulator|uniref:Carbohydrate diacid regulator n=1 Tax=Oceanotoga teriensis TaxID=515440 RepID=A0AA45HIN0_9BACT|nr:MULTISPECIES: sugar diacid recognition domain-containing protein [Oceanotoga]MDN5343722.1 carbohydrate diacid regulator [Oceanotoga sp.]MDO7976629.1 helix-turn-helix domain-containing protein [Oceanotoga teriensis]PWJ92124.1 carbohydrate diacid regulator [Oceanotoga teriensis]
MLLDNNFFQRIVENIIKKLNYNVNIMDENGYIIASGNKERIGNFHEAAYNALKTNSKIIVYKNDLNKYVGSENGINIPFNFDGLISGVIGITGNPENLKGAGKVVKALLEIMLEQEILKETIFKEKNYKSYFLNELLNNNNKENVKNIINYGKNLGYDMNKKKLPCIFELMNKGNFLYNNKRVVDIIINELEKEFIMKKEIISDISDSKIIFLKNDDIFLKDFLSIINTLQDNLYKNYSIKIKCYIYHKFVKIHDISNAYKDLIYLFSLKINHNIIYSKDYMIEIFYKNFDSEIIYEYFYEEIEFFLKNPDLFETLNVLLKNNLNISKTSENMLLHRNTIIFRLTKIKDLIDLDPLNNHKDSMKFDLIKEFFDRNDKTITDRLIDEKDF